jgi:hypothetical protein
MRPDHVLVSRRRQCAFGALVVLLHLVVFDWLSGQLGRRRELAAPAAPAPMLAQLIRAKEPVPPAVPPLQFDAPSRLTPPLPDLRPEPVEVADVGPEPVPDQAAAVTVPATPADVASDTAPDAAPATAAGTDTAETLSTAAGTPAAAGQERAAGATAGVQSQPAPGPASPAAAAAAAAPPAAPAFEPRRYKVDLPPPADITLDVVRIDADGTRWNGEARLSWRRTGSAYRIDVEAGIRIVFAQVNLLTLASEGTVGDEGFVPISMTEKRRGRAMTATHFNRKDGLLTFSASQARVALVPGTQDKASLPLQLAAIGRGDPRQMSGNIDILVGEDRGANVFSFTVAGQEQIDTRLGRIAAWHLVRPPKPGSYHARLEVWLAPDYGWLPVRMRNVEASGAVTTQTASNIVIKEPGSQ